MAKDGKLLYHLSALENLDSIFKTGLQSRAGLQKGMFEDVADVEILNSRQEHGLEQYVPFHFFAKSPFDYGVQRAHPNKDFVLVTVHRTVAQANNWKIVPRHPLADEGYEILDYDAGINVIDWALISQRDYSDRACKVACMAECLSPYSVPAGKIFCVYVKTEAVRKAVQDLADKHNVSSHINLAIHMFAGEAHV
ncbi:DarT ssDNA thymidine ADP-ribosyltransferase family protein [Methylomarinum sp. Ch1-1]|uniref:DarT ssDNA thymidine ADP-ribosyltransferase family protein n=1 Tax=Methylomarinum roseum TaxID=3067653 RepID=A0AAU7NWP4_9GAMM|nr:DarT ssDNA thymidine ADP-ribosyltransferase family protein [Methylomarinum sp. Ch1-1]MDP4522579.1 DarT ssDNA thymidine ADP-ribosyltransferase family protein [Methylomarinum sp. Ch1-1]